MSLHGVWACEDFYREDLRIRYECHKVTIRETELTLIGAVVGMQSGVYSFLVKRSGFTCSRSVGVARLLQVILSSPSVCPLRSFVRL